MLNSPTQVNRPPMRCAFWLLLSTALLVGCDSAPPQGLISGTVTYQGEPIEKGTIIFEVPGHRSAYGQIEKGEIIEVTTHKKGDGVPVGEARVAVNAIEEVPRRGHPKATPDDESAPIGASEMTPVRSILPRRYSNPQTSELTAKVQKGKNEFHFELKD